MAKTPPDAHRRTRILLVDDSERVRRGLRGLLELCHEIEVVGEAADGAEAVALSTELTPDVVLMDVAMPRLDGIEATRVIRAGRRAPRVLIVTALAGQAEAARAAGAEALVAKDAEPSELIRAVRSLAQSVPLGP